MCILSVYDHLPIDQRIKMYVIMDEKCAGNRPLHEIITLDVRNFFAFIIVIIYSTRHNVSIPMFSELFDISTQTLGYAVAEKKIMNEVPSQLRLDGM